MGVLEIIEPMIQSTNGFSGRFGGKVSTGSWGQVISQMAMQC